ncbi:MAG: hypothetical protein Q8Q39_05125 [bacterium]|nr:hypothetical protein [bacterium]
MYIIIVKERKNGEMRVAATPGEVRAYINAGSQVGVEEGAGLASGFSDDAYRNAGAHMATREVLNKFVERMSERDPFNAAVIKVKEILPDEYALVARGVPIIGFGHLAANRNLVDQVISRGGTYVSLEDIVEEMPAPHRPALAAMSRIAGEESMRLAMRHTPDAYKASMREVIIIGYGNVGQAAHRVAVEDFGLRRVTVFDTAVTKGQLDHFFSYYDPEDGRHYSKYAPNTIASYIADAREADGFSKTNPCIVILAPYSPEGRTPMLITSELAKTFPLGSVIVDVSIDQGGACEFSQATSHAQPHRDVHGVRYIGIPNIPGAVPERSTPAFAESVKPYVAEMARFGFHGSLRRSVALRGAVSLHNGAITSKGLAETFALSHTPIDEALPA